ncbi:MAG: sigma-70 family RNA polymerase sigma factor [Lachnospiraceae bacterium]|nr:sigma-70 family RNA polymerase sigma factor [Lachnospiraceae bacterium]
MTDELFDGLLERIRKKDKAALKEIYEEYIGFIYHIILDVVKNKENAEDITSEFFIKLWDKPPEYSPGRGHKGYLATIARNMAIDFIRKNKHEILDDSGPDEGNETHDTLADDSATPEEQVVSELSVKEALDALKPVYRQIITMKVLGDMTFKEIASVLEMPMGTVTWNYREAIKQLRRFGYD